MGPRTTRPGGRRRFVTILASVSVAGVLAGCFGDDQSGGSGDDQSDGSGDDQSDGSGDEIPQEVKETTEAALRQKEKAEATLGAAVEQAREENWEGCLAELDEAQDQFDTARHDAQEAFQQAEAGGHTDLADALSVLIEIIDLFDEVLPEAEALCEAGMADDRAEVRDRWENLQALSDEIEQKQEELDRLVDEIGN